MRIIRLSSRSLGQSYIRIYSASPQLFTVPLSGPILPLISGLNLVCRAAYRWSPPRIASVQVLGGKRIPGKTEKRRAEWPAASRSRSPVYFVTPASGVTTPRPLKKTREIGHAVAQRPEASRTRSPVCFVTPAGGVPHPPASEGSTHRVEFPGRASRRPRAEGMRPVRGRAPSSGRRPGPASCKGRRRAGHHV